MKNKTATLTRLATALAVLAFAPAAFAVPTITQFAVFRADRSDNPIGFAPLAYNVAAQVSPGAGTAVTVSTLEGDGDVVSYPVPQLGTGVFSGQFIRGFPYDPALTNAWTLTATDATGTATATRPAFSVEAMPFVENIGFTGIGNDITINWTVSAAGAARLDEQQVSIWDLSDPAAPVAVRFFAIGAAARSVDLSLLELTLGTPYAAEIQNVERNNVTGYVDVFSGEWLVGWRVTEGEVFVPVPEPETISLLLVGLASLLVARRARRA